MRLVHRLSLLGATACVALACFFLAAARHEERVLDAFIARSLAGVDRADTTAVVLALSHHVHARVRDGIEARALPPWERFESLSPFHVSAAVALERGVFGVKGHPPYGPCGPATRALLNTCWRLGIPARKLQLAPPPPDTGEAHTMVEWRAGDRWQVVSPADDFAWRARDGRVATVEEIRDDKEVFGQILGPEPWFHYRFDHPRHVRWEKLPRFARGMVRAAIGETRWRTMETPRLYDRPRHLLFGAASLAALAFALLAAATRRAPGARPGPRAPDVHRR
jgi:hypothetical protein